MQGIWTYTSPSITFPIWGNIDFATVESWHVTFRGGGRVLVKILDRGDDGIGRDSVTVNLTQEETAAFKRGKIQIQIKALLDGGSVVASNVIVVDSHESLEKKVIE